MRHRLAEEGLRAAHTGAQLIAGKFMTHAVTNIKTMTDNQTREKGYKAVAKRNVASSWLCCFLTCSEAGHIIPLDSGGGLK
jgi:hypothetical protein